MKSLEESIGAKLKHLRKTRTKHTQPEFAQIAGIHYGTYRLMERGKSMTLPNLEKAAAALSCPMALLFEDDEPSKERVELRALCEQVVQGPDELVQDGVVMIKALLRAQQRSPSES